MLMKKADLLKDLNKKKAKHNKLLRLMGKYDKRKSFQRGRVATIIDIIKMVKEKY